MEGFLWEKIFPKLKFGTDPREGVNNHQKKFPWNPSWGKFFMAILKNTKIAINFPQIFDQPSGGAIEWPISCEMLEVQLFELHNCIVNPIYKWPKISTVMFWKGKYVLVMKFKRIVTSQIPVWVTTVASHWNKFENFVKINMWIDCNRPDINTTCYLINFVKIVEKFKTPSRSIKSIHKHTQWSSTNWYCLC